MIRKYKSNKNSKNSKNSKTSRKNKTSRKHRTNNNSRSNSNRKMMQNNKQLHLNTLTLKNKQRKNANANANANKIINHHRGGFSSCNLATIKEPEFNIPAMGGIDGLSIAESRGEIFRPNCKTDTYQAMTQ